MSKLQDRIEIANPQQPHCATVLLLDTSGSMAGEKIAALNEGLKLFREEVSKDDLAWMKKIRTEFAARFGNCAPACRRPGKAPQP